MAKYDAPAGRTEQFLRRFQRNLLDHVAQHGSICESFGVVWEKTLQAVPLEDSVQGQIYRELIDWARGKESVRTTTGALACAVQFGQSASPSARSRK